jgi:hypothetical protein
MTILAVSVIDARPAPQTAAPAIVFRLRLEEISGVRVHAIALRCHMRIEPRGRPYSKDEQARLYELFGDVSQWDRTLQAVTWAHTALVVPTFDRRIEVDLPVPCTYDLEVAAAKYFHAVRDGDVPLRFLFSGTIFRAGEAGGAALPALPAPPARPAPPALCIEPVSWDCEALFRLPAQIWRTTMDQFFPGGGWVRLQSETIDRLQAFRGRHALVTWDEAIDRLVQHAEQIA